MVQKKNPKFNKRGGGGGGALLFNTGEYTHTLGPWVRQFCVNMHF